MEATFRSNREVILIVNTLSRHGYSGVGPARDALERHGVQVKRAIAVRSPRHIPRLIKAAVDGGAELVVVGGGDGTVTASVDPLAYKNTTLGILPMGTGNDFARALGIPMDLDGASRVIAEGKLAGVNLGHVNGDYFANAASIGVSASVSRRATGWMKRFFGFGAYILGAFEEFWTYKAFKATITVYGEKHEVQTPLVIIWNGRFHAGWELVSARGKLEGCELIVYALAAPSRLNLLRLALSLRMGSPAEARSILALETDSVTVEAQPPQDVDVDGEILHGTPVTIRLARRALKVVVPQTFEE